MDARDEVPGAVVVGGAAAPVTVPERRTPKALGRADELAAIAAAAAGVTEGALVWIGGEAGAGKTTLAEAAVAELRDQGWHTARGRCPEVSGAPPGWAWSEVLEALDGRDPLAPLLHEGPPNAFRLGRTVAGLLGGAPEPLVVLLDDVHRADDLTLHLLRQVLAQVAGRRLLVVATYRTTEVGDELAATIGALLAATAAHLRPGGLDRAAVAALAAREGLDAGPELVAMLSERTGGNPLFVRELARLIAAEGPAAARTAVPAGVRETLRRRVARLPDGVTIALRQAAVLGREADVDVLAEVARRDPDDLLDVLEIAVLAGLLDEPAPGRVRFTHALVRDTLYEDTPLLRRARLHTAALEVLRDRHADAATLARHAIAAAGPATAHEAIPFAVAAAREAATAGAWGAAARQQAEALRLAELADRHAGTATDRQAALLDLLTPMVTAQARAGDFVGARATYLRAIRVARPMGRALEVLSAWDAPLIWTVRENRDNDPEVLAAVRETLDDPALRPADRVRVLVAAFLETEGYDVAAAIRISAEAVTLAEAVGEPRLLCAALNVRAYAALGPDLREERRAAAERYQAVAAAGGEIDHEAVAHWLLFLDSAAHTDLAGAIAEMGRAVSRASTGQLGGLLGVVAIFGALLDILAGRIEQAAAGYVEVARRLTEHGATNGWQMALVGRIGIGMHRGDLSEVTDDLLAIEAGFPGRVIDPLVLALSDGGRHAEARRLWDNRLPIDRDYYWLGFTALRAHAAARVGDTAAAEQHRRTAAQLMDRISRTLSAHAGGTGSAGS